MLSILLRHLFGSGYVLPDSHRTYSILYFSYVKHTSRMFVRQWIPPPRPRQDVLYIVFFRMFSILLKHFFGSGDLLPSSPMTHSILYFSSVHHKMDLLLAAVIPDQSEMSVNILWDVSCKDVYSGVLRVLRLNDVRFQMSHTN